MSILVKGMEMPKNCHECPLLYVTSICDGFKDCPLVPVPPHGRLIDADALAAQCDDPYWCVWLSEIEDAPTIIPPEEV